VHALQKIPGPKMTRYRLAIAERVTATAADFSGASGRAKLALSWIEGHDTVLALIGKTPLTLTDPGPFGRRWGTGRTW
jgi:hypothetical protein